MSQALSIANYGATNIVQTTRLDAIALAGATSITVQNTQGFATDDYVAIGTLGGESTEMKQVSSVTGATVIGVAATGLRHEQYEYVNKLFGNKVCVYRAANVTGLQPGDASFAPLETITIQPDRSHTSYLDASGGAGYWYKFTYVNSTAGTETDLADSTAVRGGSTGDYCSIDDVRVEAGFKYAKYITDSMIDAKRQAAQHEIDSALYGSYSVPFTPPINPFIVDICKRLAAGLLLVEQYGQINSMTTNNGQAKIDQARADLKALAMKQKVLVDDTGTTLAQDGGSGSVSGWPNATTDATTATGSVDVGTMTEGQDAGPAFKRSDILGYYGRRY